ncbi:fam-a protein [Plasmodium vinckei brucechwatti]|uniref:Fam-a protein n=1 Tax=Plasmodium vinckei brucechwatti TaxID=119398 RepID=A0A6V7SWQ6_PLAVN|nr:fam-a protein [Plasmodium vinckei brucechwatti]
MNKFYIQIALFLLSIFAYANNETLATEPAPEENTTPESKDRYATSEEIYEQNKHLLCTNPEETINAGKLMNEAVKHLEYHAKCKNGFELCGNVFINNTLYYKKKRQNHTDILKVNFKICPSNQYNDIINMLWDPNGPNFFNRGTAKIDRVYNPNLVIMQQRYKKSCMFRQKYFYALATKAQISEDTTIIVMTSANINDHNPSDKEYKNTIIESANLFKTEIDSEDDIRKGKLKKVFVNIAGYLIQKKGWYIDITYLESIDGYTSIIPRWLNGNPSTGLFSHVYLPPP